ncbi:MAG: hypothetical protein HYT38_00145 [Candidatus Sungbacteria bacterium]|uniref:Uncharacterized protein n=1 Tax=Candidatus Sungiibacteriota bacterium TaxID=2750080 RepID=A0A932DS62_9BACT|nr:hypothetical protein [Candidatus Sungbacteria bacterium]MBI2465722.1 hypothetical protein [Candidatus Sungbacteria bacterium]
MEFIESVSVVMGEEKPYVVFTAGLATLRQIAAGLRAGQGEIRTARPVFLPGGQSGAALIQKYIVLDTVKIEQLTMHGISELDAIFLPWDRFDPAASDAAVQQLDRKRELDSQTVEARAMTIHQCAVKICERCLVLFWSLSGRDISEISLIRRNADPKILRAVASLGEAMRELEPAVLQAVEDLLNGEGRVLAALEGIHPPNETEAKEALDLALACVHTAFWFKKITERDALVLGYEDLTPFSAADLEMFFLVGLLANSGAWAGQGQDKHELRSVQVIRLLREHGCSLPDGLEKLALCHSLVEWKGRYVYETELVLNIGLADSREGEVSTVSFLQRDRIDEEISIQKELEPFAGMMGRLAVLKDFPAANTQVFVRRLENKFVAETLILALTEKFMFAVGAGQAEAVALSDLVLGLTVSSDYNLVLHKKRNLPMMAYALAALANAFNILPVGALVEFKDEGVQRRSTKKVLQLDGGLAVVVSPKNTNDSDSPYLLLIASNLGEVWLRPKDRKLVPLGNQLHERIYRGERRLVVGIISRAVFSQFFSKITDDIPRCRNGKKASQ